MTRILVVEDVESLRHVLATVLSRHGFSVESCSDAESASQSIKKNSYDCIISDFRLPKKNGIDLLTEARGAGIQVPFIMMTAYGSVDLAVESMKQGATDFVTKPFEPEQLLSAIQQVMEHNRIIDREGGSRSDRSRAFFTENEKMKKVLADTKRIARVDTSVMVLGESGSGKELLARFIHRQSSRKDKPFIAINCAAIPHELLESELFGHEAGSFTGATQRRIGVFELASEGTLFLDEIGDMPHQLQVKLLRTLQEREIKRVGGSKAIAVNPRIISATHQNVQQLITDGRMREDLFYRLAVISVSLPPLRERPEDIEALTKQFCEYFSARFGKGVMNLSDEAMTALKSYAWPGNIRELENVVERAVLLGANTLEPKDFGLSFGESDITYHRKSLTEVAEQAVTSAEREHIAKVLAVLEGNKTRAAKELGVSYKTLLNKVKEYGL
jgi:two-component system response regulator AtoC